MSTWPSSASDGSRGGGGSGFFFLGAGAEDGQRSNRCNDRAASHGSERAVHERPLKFCELSLDAGILVPPLSGRHFSFARPHAWRRNRPQMRQRHAPRTPDARSSSRAPGRGVRGSKRSLPARFVDTRSDGDEVTADRLVVRHGIPLDHRRRLHIRMQQPDVNQRPGEQRRDGGAATAEQVS